MRFFWGGETPPGLAGGGSGSGIGGSTGSTDNAILRADGTGGATVQATGVLIDDANALSGALRARRAGAGGITLAAADIGRTVSIIVGGGSDEVTLPAAPAPGAWYAFVILGTDELTVQAQGSHVIYAGSVASLAGGIVKSSTKGSYIVLEYVNTNMWAASTQTGTWVTV